MREFVLSGSFKMGSQIKEFNKTMNANDAEHAKELLLCHLGSKHGTPRRFINILEVLESGEMEGGIVLPNENELKED